MISYYKSDVGTEEKKAVLKVLDSCWLTHGEITEEFESMFADACKAKYALATNSCTAALHLALLAIEKNQEIYTTAYTYASTWQAIQYTKSRPVFVDNSKNSFYNPRFINPFADLFIVVHFAGKYSVVSINDIEDASHRFPGKFWGRISCYSFYANKLITTGEGGMLVTNDKDVRDNVYELRYHGRDKYTSDYNINRLGYKYNMSDIQAAIGIEQLKKMHLKREKHSEIAHLYNKHLADEINRIVDDGCHYHLYPIWSEKAEQIKTALKNNDIEYSHHYKIFVENAHTLPNAYKISSQEISLPIYFSLTNKEILKICEVINESIM